MKRVNVRFDQDEGRLDIDVLFRASDEDEQVRTLMGRVADPLAGTLTAFDADGSAIIVAQDRIVSVCAENKRVRIVTDDGAYHLRSSLQEAERALNPQAFIRISRFEIVNLSKVRRFDFTVTGTLRIEFEQGTQTWASRRFISQIKARLQGRG